MAGMKKSALRVRQRALQALDREYPDCLTTNQLKNLLSVSRVYMTKTLTELLNDGMIERVANRYYRRKK